VTGRRFDVVVLGSLHLDVMVATPRLPVLGETLPGTGWAFKCGGKGGNQAVAAARQGASVAMVGAVGDDDFGPRLTRNLAAAGVDVAGVRVARAHPTGMSVALQQPDGDYAAVIVSGVNQHLGATDVDAALARLRARGVLVLQHEIAPAANRLAASRLTGALRLLNAAPARPLDHPVDVLVVNALEAEMLGAAPVRDLATALRAARTLRNLAARTVVTAGAHGAAYASEGEEGTVDAIPVQVASTHGAGDTFVGALAARLAAGDGLAAACGRANEAAAALVATSDGGQRV
jgi:ribokinase